jgi:flagellar M-ring protein FliF
MVASWQRWNRLAPRERLIAGSLACIVVVSLAFLVSLQRDTRVALFAAPLRTEQIAEVVERLAEWNEPFAVVPDNVRVDVKRRNDLLLKLSLAGVPHAHLATSAEALEKAGPLTPQSVLDAQQRDGLAGDLAAALRGLAGIDDAQVIIAPARDGTFSDEPSHAATASVKLDLKAGSTPTRDQLEGVRQFVAAGVPGLDPKRVAVLDDRGNALGTAPSAGDGEQAQLQASLQSALDLALGAGAAVVRVRVSYDQRNRERHDVMRRPASDSAIATTTADERFKSPSKTYAKTSRAVDRGSVTEEERTDTPAGHIERISVAIAVDQARRFDLAKIRSLAAGALGLDNGRGDSVSVEEIAFPRAPERPHGFAYGAALGLVGTVAPSLVFAVAVLAGVRLGAKPAGRAVETIVQRIAVGRATRAVATFTPAHVRGALQNEPPHTAAAIISALPAATATAVLELYPAEERAAIVRRMSRPAAPVVPDHESVLRRG